MEKLSDYWKLQSQLRLQQLVNQKSNFNTAKNVIFLLGDGMSISTVTSARMLLGGEEQNLSFEKFPHFGFSKVWTILIINLQEIIIKLQTYCVDSQVADSACTSTAYLR